RYDGLVEQLGGSATPAIGWASGIERLILLMKGRGIERPQDGAQVYFCALGEQALLPAARLAEQLRDALPGLRLTLNAGGGKLAAQLRRADKCGARFALILGEDETTRRTVQVKSLRDSTPPASFAWAELPARLAGLLQLN
ncbi:MAG: histidine--tRNA ligase, partial [Hydrocarboniphaga effusa]|nr:histidine--tRNA ligase [Hydrocarboniphaga effusa]